MGGKASIADPLPDSMHPMPARIALGQAMLAEQFVVEQREKGVSQCRLPRKVGILDVFPRPEGVWVCTGHRRARGFGPPESSGNKEQPFVKKSISRRRHSDSERLFLVATGPDGIRSPCQRCRDSGSRPLDS